MLKEGATGDQLPGTRAHPMDPGCGATAPAQDPQPHRGVWEALKVKQLDKGDACASLPLFVWV